MASFQSLQATLVTRPPLTTNPLFEGNASVANLPIATSTLGKEPMSSCPPNPIIGGTSRTKPFDLNAGVTTVQSNDQEETQVVKSITEDEDKFKLPEFDKYNGTGCPYAHLTMYCRKMAPYANDEKLMIHYFQDSLTGPADAWFSTLDKSKVKSWHDLTHNFMKQYEYNTSLAPSREDLQKTEKKPSESFKEFAQRWRGLAARVQPPLTDHELSNLFIKSTKGPYPPTFHSTAFTSQSRPIYASGTSRPQQEKKRRYFDKLPMSYTEVFRQLIAARLVTPVPMVPLNPPFPIWYNPQARCEYHSGGVGHDLENCLALKHRVQDLIDAKELQITSEPEVVGPNITKNPLPTHDGPTVNMIEKDSDKGRGDDKLTLPTHGEALDNKTVEILLVPIIKSKEIYCKEIIKRENIAMIHEKGTKNRVIDLSVKRDIFSMS
ncbi:hypothetical protein SLEP1_g43032 [Rubroshorea leprosula]|uniref:Retrotransposon gag domain-containing protein n=1 Tax=Rubroshorea leprosula TaxID=152421 RepID=A0AAV5LBQ7_9ROSI|nr:hypothetical protein SLEP1_g43032 [Rubroshorea leprosula]